MAKFYGAVGYGESREIRPGVYKDAITERVYSGDVLRNMRGLEKSEHQNDNINVKNSISIVADAYAIDHFFAIRYVNWMGVNWTVTDVEVQHPRLIFTIGGVYNGPTA